MAGMPLTFSFLVLKSIALMNNFVVPVSKKANRLKNRNKDSNERGHTPGMCYPLIGNVTSPPFKQCNGRTNLLFDLWWDHRELAFNP